MLTAIFPPAGRNMGSLSGKNSGNHENIPTEKVLGAMLILSSSFPPVLFL